MFYIRKGRKPWFCKTAAMRPLSFGKEMKVGTERERVIKIPRVYGGPGVPPGRFIFSDLSWHLNFPMMRKHSRIGGRRGSDSGMRRFISAPEEQFIIPSLGGIKVDYGIGLSYRPVRLYRLAGRYDIPVPMSTLSPSKGL